ncbi:hypothetical protein TWF102_000229 [Orbilia oligospora]|uniref:Uncharacterized protein n=1 Tax=Orbilia oligospora TaxID=2813651 RepID=A0A7C8NBS3_ORBOL|nr:hypothetical protein TWF102_000229 [Orbilia oligospora]KAF3115330.1 hypothetical protein TWF103_011588 [Orbilia oligospora]KAF3116778.1 hypothetical protein TWF706_000003 [Orbilia oligospora]
MDKDLLFTSPGRFVQQIPNFSQYEGVTTLYEERSESVYEDILFTSLRGSIAYIPKVTQHEGLKSYRGPILFFTPLAKFKMVGSMTIPGLGGVLETPTAYGLKAFDFHGPSHAHDYSGFCFTCVLILLSRYCPQLELIRLRTDDKQISASVCCAGFAGWKSAANLRSLDITPSLNILMFLIEILASPQLEDVFLDLSSFEIDVELIQSIIRSWTKEFPQAIKTFGSSSNSCQIKLPT